MKWREAGGSPAFFFWRRWACLTPDRRALHGKPLETPPRAAGCARGAVRACAQDGRRAAGLSPAGGPNPGKVWRGASHPTAAPPRARPGGAAEGVSPEGVSPEGASPGGPRRRKADRSAQGVKCCTGRRCPPPRHGVRGVMRAINPAGCTRGASLPARQGRWPGDSRMNRAGASPPTRRKTWRPQAPSGSAGQARGPGNGRPLPPHKPSRALRGPNTGYAVAEF